MGKAKTVEEVIKEWNKAAQEGSQKNDPAGIPINQNQSLAQAINNAIL